MKWSKKLCIQYMTEMRSYLEEMQQSSAQMPSLMQRLAMQPRKMKIQELLEARENGQAGQQMNEEMVTEP